MDVQHAETDTVVQLKKRRARRSKKANGGTHDVAEPKKRGRPAAAREPHEAFTDELFAEAWSEVTDLEKTKSTGDANLSSFYAKQEKRGMHRSAFQAVRKLVKKDVAQAAAHHRNYLRYIAASGLMAEIEAHEADLFRIAETEPAA